MVGLQNQRIQKIDQSGINQILDLENWMDLAEKMNEIDLLEKQVYSMIDLEESDCASSRRKRMSCDQQENSRRKRAYAFSEEADKGLTHASFSEPIYFKKSFSSRQRITSFENSPIMRGLESIDEISPMAF